MPLRSYPFWLPRIGAGRPLFLLLFLFCATPLHARPQVLVILADHLTLTDVTRSDLSNLTRLREEGQLALMSPGLAQKPDPVANVYATLGAGDTVRVGDVSQGRMADALRRTGVRTALIGNADGDDTGSYRPALLFLPNPDVTADGTVSDPIAPGGKRIDPAKLWAATQAASLTCDLIVVHFGGLCPRRTRKSARLFAACCVSGPSLPGVGGSGSLFGLRSGRRADEDWQTVSRCAYAADAGRRLEPVDPIRIVRQRSSLTFNLGHDTVAGFDCLTRHRADGSGSALRKRAGANDRRPRFGQHSPVIPPLCAVWIA